MHYFRLRRNGDFTLKLDKKKEDLGYTRVYRITMPGRGYQRLYEPTHPLRDSQGYIAEHRMVMYAKYGAALPDCELCGVPLNWSTCHIDHKDRDVKNNVEENLRPLCPPCNTWRDYPAQASLEKNHRITIDGVTLTPEEWSRVPGVKVSGRTIIGRKSRGYSDFDAVYAQKITHNGRKRIAPAPKTNHKHERSNAVAISIEGVTMTAAEWSRFDGAAVTENTIIDRFRAGWDATEAIVTPAFRRPAGYEAKTAEFRAKVRELKGRAA
ncbi:MULTISPECIES: HNH endonuclease signature motif containing protein [unclassified Pseudomonas]|uniref:HNH endonuclease signature motif containing protein n=1 Tax=unclassified Pseudomonas TaxID=196821 RepID=UPI000806A6B7|nr:MULTISPECIES: HNH endonuclease signature motif containing protein [unclassified Pseudomonas]